MSEFILELYSEEIPPNLQINARNDLQEKIKSSLIEENLKIGSLKAYSSPTRLTILLKDFSDKIKIPSREIRGPKVGVIEDIVNNFLKAHDSSAKDLIEKQNEKGEGAKDGAVGGESNPGWEHGQADPPIRTIPTKR